MTWKVDEGELPAHALMQSTMRPPWGVEGQVGGPRSPVHAHWPVNRRGSQMIEAGEPPVEEDDCLAPVGVSARQGFPRYATRPEVSVQR